MLLTRLEMIAAEASAFRNGATPASLMQQAGHHLAQMVRQFHPQPGFCHVFYGKGHNGGDVLVAARYLAEAGWQIGLEGCYPVAELAPLTATHRDALHSSAAPSIAAPYVILDGLLGIGSQGDPRWPVDEAIEKINRLRSAKGAWVLAADTPSGLDVDTGRPGKPCVIADATMCIGYAKRGLLSDDATAVVGRLAVARLEAISLTSATDHARVSQTSRLRAMLPPRRFEIHKGQCGRVTILAGHVGTTGAAYLCAAGALAAGAGLVTVRAHESIYATLASIVPPEIMVRPLSHLGDVLSDTADVLAIGPGLGLDNTQDICTVLREATIPCVVDAAALRALASQISILTENASPRLLTPHPGEMEQLSPQAGRCRRLWAQEFCDEHRATILLKGARSLICEHGQEQIFNSTGHPGMATGGMGDVLTGLCAGLMAQGKTPRDAATLGAWLCGRSAEIAISHGESQESLTARHVVRFLGGAFTSLRAGAY